jgi:flagellar biosynthetic protein FlhB
LAEGPDKDSKTEEATPRKLDDARKKGDVAKSPDVASALSLMGASAVILMGGSWFATRLAEQLVPFVASPHAMVGAFHAGAGIEIGAQALWAALPIIAVVMLATIVGGSAGNLMQSGLIFTNEKIKPKWSKVNPLEGMKRIFGPDGLVQFIKTLLKLIATGWIAWAVLKPHTRELEHLAAMGPAAILPLVRDLAVALLGAMLFFLAVTSAVDWLWQRYRFAERMKMSREELKEDFKQAEGDPHVKAKLKQIRAQKSRQRMMQNVETATVVVTNPTHYSVALRYEPDKGDAAPICVAKGVDTLALRIREKAREHGVPVIENVPLARALYASVDVDQTIPREHFEAAAKVIGFVLGARKRR